MGGEIGEVSAIKKVECPCNAWVNMNWFNGNVSFNLDIMVLFWLRHLLDGPSNTLGLLGGPLFCNSLGGPITD